MANYKCLVLDHDDTVVQSAKTVNYPSYVESLHILRPGMSLSYEEFTVGLFRDDFEHFCSTAFGYTRQELDWHFNFWKSYVRTHKPPVYAGIPELLQRFRKEGGIICMASYSAVENISRDFKENIGFLPDRIYSADLPPEKRKPNPFPLQDIMEYYHLEPQQLLMVDDMRGGLDMANRCGVPFACAGWSHDVQEVADFMRTQSPVYLKTVDDFSRLVFGE